MKLIGKDSGIRGAVIVSLLAFIQAGPLYAAFPVAYSLWRKGCSRFNIFLYLGAFPTFKIPMLMFEAEFAQQQMDGKAPLGINGCNDCHSYNAAFFLSPVVEIPFDFKPVLYTLLLYSFYIIGIHVGIQDQEYSD